MVDNNVEHLINGKKKEYSQLYYCETARKSDRMCGKEGLHYEDKNQKDNGFEDFDIETYIQSI